MEWTWHLKVQSALYKCSFCEFMIVSKSHNRFRKGAKSASGAPGPKSAPRGSKSTTFGKGVFQSFSLRSFRNRRLVRCELRVDTGFEIYGSSIGV